MREILFRGKGMKDGEWHYGSLQVFKGYSIFDNVWNNFIPVWSKTVGQFTGLRDKNCVRIFEGDIVTVDGIIYACRWDEGNFEFGLWNNRESFGIAYASHEAEVVGNIHDNPELVQLD